MRRHIINSSILAIAVSVSGCASGPPSVFRQFNLDRGYSVSADATQRVIINSRTHPSSRPGRVNPERIVCAEPSPDVASVVANSFAFSGNLFGKGNVAVSADQAQALAQLAERTVTVQLLRDQMYRACEAYANGAISGTDYSLLMSRNNDAMVTLMLGEAASRTVGRDLATLYSNASSNATASMPAIGNAAKEAVEANEASNQADEELAAAEEKEAAAVQMAATATTDVAADAAADNADGAKKETQEKQEVADDAKEEAAEKNENLIEATTGGSAAATASKGGGPFGQLNKEAVEVAENLGKMQRAYLDKGAEQHFISACIVELGSTRKPFDYDEAKDREPSLYFVAKELTEHQRLVADAILQSYGISSVPEFKYAVSTGKTYGGVGLGERMLRYALKDKKVEDLSTEERNSKIEGIWERLISDLKKVDEIGEPTLIEALQTSLIDFVEKEKKTPFYKALGSRGKKSDRIWRGVMAVQDRDSASILAGECLRRLPEMLEREHNTHFVNDVLDFVEDVEEERASVLKKQSESGGGDKKKSPLAPSIGSAATMKATGDLVQCSADTYGEACQKKAIDGIVASLGVGVRTDGGSNPNAPVPKPYAGDLSSIAAYDAAEVAYAKLIDAINEFEKHPLGACPESCGRCLAEGGSCPDQRGRGGKKTAASGPACAKRCQAIIAHGYDARENELKAAIRQQQEAFQKAFGFTAKSGLAAEEKSLAETNKKLAASRDEKEKAEFAAKKEQFEFNLVTARNKYKDAKTAFEKTAGDIGAYLKKIEDLPKE